MDCSLERLGDENKLLPLDHDKLPRSSFDADSTGHQPVDRVSIDAVMIRSPISRWVAL